MAAKDKDDDSSPTLGNIEQDLMTKQLQLANFVCEATPAHLSKGS